MWLPRSRIINYCKGWTKLGGNDLKLNFIWGSGNVLTNRGSNKIWNKWWSPVKYPCILGISTVSIVHHCFNSTNVQLNVWNVWRNMLWNLMKYSKYSTSFLCSAINFSLGGWAQCQKLNWMLQNMLENRSICQDTAGKPLNR